MLIAYYFCILSRCNSSNDRDAHTVHFEINIQTNKKIYTHNDLCVCVFNIFSKWEPNSFCFLSVSIQRRYTIQPIINKNILTTIASIKHRQRKWFRSERSVRERILLKLSLRIADAKLLFFLLYFLYTSARIHTFK